MLRSRKGRSMKKPFGLEHVVSLNVRFLNGTLATYYAQPHDCLDAAKALSHACETIAVYLNQDIGMGDTMWTADLLEGMPE